MYTQHYYNISTKTKWQSFNIKILEAFVAPREDHNSRAEIPDSFIIL